MNNSFHLIIYRKEMSSSDYTNLRRIRHVYQPTMSSCHPNMQPQVVSLQVKVMLCRYISYSTMCLHILMHIRIIHLLLHSLCTSSHVHSMYILPMHILPMYILPMYILPMYILPMYILPMYILPCTSFMYIIMIMIILPVTQKNMYTIIMNMMQITTSLSLYRSWI